MGLSLAPGRRASPQDTTEFEKCTPTRRQERGVRAASGRALPTASLESGARYGSGQFNIAVLCSPLQISEVGCRAHFALRGRKFGRAS